LILCGELTVLQAPILECAAFDPFSLFEDSRASAKIDVGGREVVEALVITLMVIVLDERLDLGVEIAWEEVIVEQNAVLQGLVPPLDFTLGLRMERRTADMTHALCFDPCGQICRDVARPIV